MVPLDIWASLTYMGMVQTRPITVAETQGFMRAAQKIWSEQELNALINHLAHNPDDESSG